MSVLSIFQLIMALLNQIAPMLIPLLTHPTGAGPSHTLQVHLTAAEAATVKELLAHATVKP